MPTELVELPSGSFRMGSTSFYPEEAPIHTVTVPGFAVERHPVTNDQFAEFVSATGYMTVAEQPIDPALYPGVDPGELGAVTSPNPREERKIVTSGRPPVQPRSPACPGFPGGDGKPGRRAGTWRV